MAGQNDEALKSGYRSLITHVEGLHAAAPRVNAAAALARRLDALLIGVGAQMVQPAAYTDPTGMVGGEMLIAARQMLADDLKRAQEIFAAATKDVRNEWITIEERPAPALTRLARAADLIVAGGAPIGGDDAYRMASAGELILQSGRPVLIAPPAGGDLDASRILLAWKDTREARRALSDALPFLKAADEVLVLEACANETDAGDSGFPLASVVAHLTRHGVKARAEVTLASRDDAAEAIINAAGKMGAGLIVAGGYGHTRLGEWIFGGVTRDLLRNAQGYVLMSH